jgi:hypothetical protein
MKTSYEMTPAEIELIIKKANALPNKTKAERQKLATCWNRGATQSMRYGAAAQVLKNRNIEI